MMDMRKIAEKILNVQELPEGYLTKYYRDIDALSRTFGWYDFQEKIRDRMGEKEN